ncbi:hypothetical protein PaG_01004 [Moesziomyces aphidis]|uniref:Uncharacterized protein n=1 Tax=Moesziomyces aphidis TaxID=84754 RepID=W3VSK0_MOEAP|nr:hypothetical protein PaG_01004 [Moesziomyces aphidis]
MAGLDAMAGPSFAARWKEDGERATVTVKPCRLSAASREQRQRPLVVCLSITNAGTRGILWLLICRFISSLCTRHSNFLYIQNLASPPVDRSSEAASSSPSGQAVDKNRNPPARLETPTGLKGVQGCCPLRPIFGPGRVPLERRPNRPRSLRFLTNKRRGPLPLLQVRKTLAHAPNDTVRERELVHLGTADASALQIHAALPPSESPLIFLFLLVRVASTLLHLPLLLPLPRDFASPAAIDRIQAVSLRNVGSAVAVYRQSLTSSLPLPRVLHPFCIAALGSSELSGPDHLFPLLRGSVDLDSTLSPHLA